MRPKAKRFVCRYSAVLCASLLAEASALEEALDAASFSAAEAAFSLLEELEASLFASELEEASDLDSALDSLAEVLWLSLVEALELPAWDELAASPALDALELLVLPELLELLELALDALLEELELVLWDVLPEELLPDWEPDSEVTPLPMETVRLLLLTVEPL